MLLFLIHQDFSLMEALPLQVILTKWRYYLAIVCQSWRSCEICRTALCSLQLTSWAMFMKPSFLTSLTLMTLWKTSKPSEKFSLPLHCKFQTRHWSITANLRRRITHSTMPHSWNGDKTPSSRMTESFTRPTKAAKNRFRQAWSRRWQMLVFLTTHSKLFMINMAWTDCMECLLWRQPLQPPTQRVEQNRFLQEWQPTEGFSPWYFDISKSRNGKQYES